MCIALFIRHGACKFFYHIRMHKCGRIILLAACVLCGATRAGAFFPFSSAWEELKTDYSQTVWDRIMQEQSSADMRRGMQEMSAAQYSRAQNSFAKAVIKNTRDPLAYLLYGASLYWSGKVDAAMAEYREALRLDPQNAMGYQLLAIAYGWKGDVQTAQEHFLTANRLDPYKADTHMNLGSTYAVQKNWDQALTHYRQAVELAPRSPLFHYQLGALYEALGRDAQAEASFKKALALFPYYEDVQLSLGALYEKTGDTSAALKYFKKAVKTKPGDFAARLRYAALLQKTGDAPKAREALEEAFSIVRLQEDGLALNAVYRADGRDGRTFGGQIEKFKQSLSKISPSKDIQVEVALEYTPAQDGSDLPSGQLERIVRKTFSGAAAEEKKPVAFTRSFVLNAADAPTRTDEINALAAGLADVAAHTVQGYHVSMRLQGRTADYSAPSALTQHTQSAAKAAYDPRIVGNDMGLWVTGKSWIKFVDEIYDDMRESAQTAPPDDLPYLLLGLADLVLGDAAGAAQHFRTAQSVNPADVLAELGLGTAAVIAADDELAALHYQAALALAPGNKTAARNLAVLKE